MCVVSSLGILEGFATSGGIGSSGKSPIVTYAELVSNSYSSEVVQSHCTSGVARTLKVLGHSMISEFRAILKQFLGYCFTWALTQFSRS